MKKLILLLLWLSCTLLSFAQTSEDPALNQRLATYMQLNKKLQFDEMMDYVHPSLFTIAPRKQLVTVFKQTFDNDEMKMWFDSMSISSISQPLVRTATYRRINYYMEFKIRFADSSLFEQEEMIETIKTSMKKGFPDADITFNKQTKTFDIKGIGKMLAIKDNAQSPWYFLGVDADRKAIMDRLLPKEVITHFKLL